MQTPLLKSFQDEGLGKKIRGIAFDIDDTFSSEGKILPQAFSALWQLKRAGYFLVPITGRPAGWCDHIVRFWPVDAVVGENGAFSFYFTERHRTRLLTPGAEASPAKLNTLREKILAAFPEAVFASDQAYREYDLAIDFCEDVSPWPMERVMELKAFCEAAGAVAKVSSIHLNTWFGNYSKVDGFSALLAARSDFPQANDAWLFMGDSPNDAPLFKHFKYSVGVQNITPFLVQMENHPRWVTSHPSGEGFCEVVETLMKSRFASA